MFKCGVLNNDGVAALARHCRCLTTLDIECDRITADSSLVQLCIVNANSLCQKVVDIGVFESHVSLLSGIGLPIRKYGVVLEEGEAAVAILDCLAVTSAISLESLALRFFCNTAPSNSATRLLQRCSNLTELNISHVQQNLSVEILLPAIPSLSKLRKLCIGCSTSSNVANLSALLDGFRMVPNNSILELTFGWNIPVSDSELHVLAEVFPRLFTLNVLHYGVNVSVMLDLICAGTLKAKRIKVDRGRWLSEELRKHGVRHHLANNDDMELWLSL